MSVSRNAWLNALAFTLFGALVMSTPAVEAYNPVTPTGTPVPGAGRVTNPPSPSSRGILPTDAWSKEYSHDVDFDTATPDPLQVLLWDGAGGTANGFDHTGNPYTDHPDAFNRDVEAQVDAIANSRDALLDDLILDTTAMAFSYDDRTYGYDYNGTWRQLTVPSVGNLSVSGGTLAGAGELTKGTNSTVGFSQWAGQNAVDSRAAMPRDLDGVELWGVVAAESPTGLGDANKYSLARDVQSGWSVWNSDGTAYLPHADVVSAVNQLLGPTPSDAIGAFPGMPEGELIDVDAVMVRDLLGSTQSWGACGTPFCIDLPTGVDQEGQSVQLATGPTPALPDTVVFSIRQIPLQNGGYHATGSELFVLDSNGTVSFLNHGGQTWDSSFAMNNLHVGGLDGITPQTSIESAILDINALEALGNLVIPDPLPGDINADGSVDLLDLDILGTNWGGYGVGQPGGDINNDNVVDLLDLDILGGNFGVSVGPAMAAAVPEPTSLLLLAGLLGVAAAARRRV